MLHVNRQVSVKKKAIHVLLRIRHLLLSSVEKGENGSDKMEGEQIGVQESAELRSRGSNRSLFYVEFFFFFFSSISSISVMDGECCSK